MRKRERLRRRVKHRVDYRYRWPTQQTLIESRVSVNPPRSKRRWKPGVGLLRRLKRRSSPEPGKSTHPYDTGIGGQGSGSSPSPNSTSETWADSPRCWKMFTRMPPTPPPPPALPSPAPIPKFSHIRDETRPETPKTPVQYLRLLASTRKSPFPRSRTATPSDFDKATVKSTRSRIQTPAPPPMASQPVVNSPKTLWGRFGSIVKNMFRRRTFGWACS
ncbi:hypothetical protein F4782DRAFT_524720 [Xylaria castorea]|nr:hypothetical protein F4782DRAFT_524720 [Xylaria castorea]